MSSYSEAEGVLLSTSTSPVGSSYVSSDEVEESATRDNLEDDVLDENLGKELVIPHMQRRLTSPATRLSRSVIYDMKTILRDQNNQQPTPRQSTATQDRCYKCPRSKDRKVPPTCDLYTEIKDIFYQDFALVLSRIKPQQDIIIAGDLNARVKSREDDDVVGRFAENIEDDSGEQFIELFKQYKLKLTNTDFAHKDIHSYTWERPLLGQKSTIEYVFTKKHQILE
ncbi:hypothetical protein ILUMI_07903 [Ignelater luminosus]|uniref:Endonuclease/exonuclease/phosphatase domain-containing protein n=1 Tax=Ignelater luminosus TaxID=2038154 RepID=A0A8K0GDX7_IGNLU|nr:hypothetical protein ILUMI_07903 [Ignelater luminosus]